MVVNYRGGGASDFFSRAFKVVKPTLNRASAIIVPSEYLREVFSRWGIESIVVPNIVDLTRFYPEYRDPQSRRRRGPHIIVTRNLEKIYDISTALRVFARVRNRWPDAFLTVAGEGPERAALAQLAEDLGISDAVTFAGRLDNDVIPDMYRDADLMLNTSRVDNMPVSFLEALASGVPIVSTAVGGIPFLVKDGEHALLAPVGDVEQLAKAIEFLWSNDTDRRRMVKAGRRFVKQFEWTDVREKLLSVYDHVLDARPKHKDGCQDA